MKKITIGLSVMAAALMAVILMSCTVPVVVKSPDGTQHTEQQIDPRLRSALDTIGTIGGVTPQPWGWIAGAGAAAAGAIVQTLANRKNKQAAQTNQTEADKWSDVATTIIQGVEAAGDAAQKVKESIAARSRSDGNERLVHQVVQEELRPS